MLNYFCLRLYILSYIFVLCFLIKVSWNKSHILIPNNVTTRGSHSNRFRTRYSAVCCWKSLIGYNSLIRSRVSASLNQELGFVRKKRNFLPVHANQLLALRSGGGEGRDRDTWRRGRVPRRRESASRRDAFTPLMNSTSQTAVGPLSLEAGADCDFSFYRAARLVIRLNGKEITVF